MDKIKQKKLIARLRRLSGQARALEIAVTKEPEKFVTELEAVVAAAKASLRFYIEEEMLVKDELSVSDKRLLARLLSKLS